MANELLGIVRPFRRDGRSDFRTASGVELVRSAVGQILGTMGASESTQGEIPWRTEEGSLLYLLRNRKNDSALQELARVYVVEALQRWEPRVKVTSVVVTRERVEGDNTLAIRLKYDLLSTNTSGNNVVASGIEQTVRL
jgi:uncharacterized protein